MINGYVSFKTVLNKLYRDLGISTEINEIHVAEWIAEVLDKIGSYYQYKEAKTCLTLQNGRARLPLNFHRLKDIAFNSKPLSWESNTLNNDYLCEGCSVPKCCTDYKFYISDSYIVTDIPETELNSDGNNDICVVYLGVPVDSEGYPLVPDDVYFMEACAKYVTYMLDYREYRKGNIPRDIFERSEREYLFYVGAAKGAANMPGTHQTERLLNTWVRLIPKRDEFDRLFINISERERKYLK